MSYGFLARNRDGDVLIDGERPHTFLAYSEQVILPAGPPDFQLREVPVEFPPTTLPPTVLYRSEDSWFFEGGIDTNAQGEYYRTLVYVPVNESAGKKMEIAVFLPQGGIQDDSEYGLQVFGPTGDLVYDSRKKTLVVHYMDEITMQAHIQSGGAIPVDQQVLEFPATPHKPWIFMDLSWAGISGAGLAQGGYHLRVPCIGPLRKNGNDEYDGFWVANRSISYLGLSQRQGPDEWKMQWVVFV